MNRMALTGLLSILLLTSAEVHASDEVYASSAICRPKGTATFDVNDGGNLYNLSTTAAGQLVCGITGQGIESDSNDDVYVNYDDENGTSSSSNDFVLWCEVLTYEEEAEQTSFVVTSRRWGCATAGGCTTAPSTSYASSGYLEFLNIQKSATLYLVNVLCSVPEFDGSGRASEITSIRYDED